MVARIAGSAVCMGLRGICHYLILIVAPTKFLMSSPVRDSLFRLAIFHAFTFARSRKNLPSLKPYACGLTLHVS